MDDPLLSLEEVDLTLSTRSGWFRFKTKHVLQDVNLHLEPGDRLALVGSNGAGKSTLLSVAAGLIRPDRGCITRQPGLRSMLLTLGMGFDMRLTGRMNAELSAIFLGATREQAREAMPQIIELAELQDYIDTPMSAYSAGMKARLSFAVSQVLHAELLLIDEMLGVGDQRFQERSSQALRERICGDQTVVIVSHNLRMLVELCERGLWLSGGRVRMEGSVEEVIHAYTQSELLSAKHQTGS